MKLKNFVRIAKSLILLFFAASTLAGEPESDNERIKIVDGQVNNIMVALHFFPDIETLNKAAKLMEDGAVWEELDLEDDEYLHGFSRCERRVQANIAFCDIYVVGPGLVDGMHTLTMGHELLHGVLGEYHD
jgi:hypothetical protein